MFEFTSLFLSNLLGDSLFTLVPSTTSLPGYSTIISGSNISTSILNDDDDPLFDTLLSSVASSVGTTVINSVEDAYETTKKQLKVTDAYIESLNEEELNYLITRLEEKEKLLISEEDKRIKVKNNNKKN